MAGKLTVRKATVEDLPQVLHLVNAAYRGTGETPGWTSEMHLLSGPRMDEKRYIALMADETRSLLLFISDDDGTVSACVCVEHKAATNQVYLGMLSVSPKQQGTGIGRFVLQTAEEQAVALWGVKSAIMNVINKRDELIAYYERRGYIKSGDTEPFPYEQLRGIEDALCEDMFFVRLVKPLK